MNKNANKKNCLYITYIRQFLKNKNIIYLTGKLGLKKGERVMQGIFITYKKVSKELLVNKARTNGFGSSDIK